MQEGQLPGEDGAVGPGQNLVVPLLERCLKFCDIVEEKYVQLHPLTRPVLTLVTGRVP